MLKIMSEMETTSDPIPMCTAAAVFVEYNDKADDQCLAQDFHVCMSFLPLMFCLKTLL